MTPEARARAFLASYMESDLAVGREDEHYIAMLASAIRDAENAKINQVLHLVAQREIAKDIGAPVIGTHCEAIAKLKSKGETA